MVDVSVYMITYFHQDYIEQALESVLSQKTRFSYEIVVSDDCSTDGTMDILRHYEKQYPDIIRVYHHEKNIGIPKNIFFARTHCNGKYIVALSGDDYWICDDKIEKQASFLEMHKEYVGVCNGMELRYDNDSKSFDVLPTKKERDRVFRLNNYEAGETLYTHGLMMRNFFLTEDGREYFGLAQKISDKVDDAVDNVLLLKKGDVFIMDLITDVYRVPRDKSTSNNYNSKYTRMEKSKNTIDLYNNMYRVLKHEINLKAKYINAIAIALLDAIISRKIKEFNVMYKSIPEEYRYPIISGVLIKCFPKAVAIGFKYVFKKFILSSFVFFIRRENKFSKVC